MKTRKQQTPNLAAAVILLFLVLFPTVALRAQHFTDLNFEASANTLANTNEPVVGFEQINETLALPHWTAYYDGSPQTTIWGILDALDQTAVQMVGLQEVHAGTDQSPNDYFKLNPGTAIDGSLSVNLYGVNFGGVHVASISQTAQIPVGIKSIQFLLQQPAYASLGNSSPTVTFNGNLINVTPLSVSNGVVTMVGDVSAYAGVVGNLSFAAVPLSLQGQPGGTLYNDETNFTLDDISFSTQAAPEPSAWMLGLIAFGGFCALARSGPKSRVDCRES